MATATGDGTLCDTAADIAEGMCIDEASGTANDGYVMNPDPAYAPWSNFVTWYAINGVGVDDSGHDFDPSCLADGDPTDCSGRLTFHFSPTCIPQIEMREVCAEFIEVGTDGCGVVGDVSSDGVVNVLDVVSLVQCVLGGNCSSDCSDVNGDGTNNVLDVVTLVQIILADNAKMNGAKSAEFNVIKNEVTMSADGYVGGIQMTLSHSSDFALTLTDGGEFSDYLTKGNTTTLIIVEPTNDNLFTTNGDFTIESIIATADGASHMNTSVNMLKDFSISAAYPNPFNPTTQLSITLNTTADVSVKIFNMNGQLIDVIANGQMSSGSYDFTWDATNASSGVYFIQTEIGSEVQNQKIILIK